MTAESGERNIPDVADSMLQEHAEDFERFRAQAAELDALGRLTVGALRNGNKILVCGNGGSAAEADHFAGELVGRFRGERPSLPALALSSSPAGVTAIGNDYGYERVFARQIESLGAEGDLLFVLSTSGQSANLVEAVKQARDRGVITIGLLGRDGGPVAPLCDHTLIVESRSTARIQEMHLLSIHILCEMIDRAFGA